MKKFLAIGHFKGSENTTSVADFASNKACFIDNLKGNEFVAYVIISEKKLNDFKDTENNMEIYEMVKKMTSNYRKWNEVTEYIEQCMDIMKTKMENIEM